MAPHSQEAPPLTSEVVDPHCSQCGQADVGQTGERQCEKCGLSTLWDRVPAGMTAEQIMNAMRSWDVSVRQYTRSLDQLVVTEDRQIQLPPFESVALSYRRPLYSEDPSVERYMKAGEYRFLSGKDQ